MIFFPSDFPNENDKTKYIAILAAVGQTNETEHVLQLRDLFVDC